MLVSVVPRDQAENWLLWTVAQEDEVGGAGAAWEDEAVCVREAQARALTHSGACLASDASSLEAAFPRTLLSPSHEPQGPKPPETSLHPRVYRGSQAQPGEEVRAVLRPAGEWLSPEVCSETPWRHPSLLQLSKTRLLPCVLTLSPQQEHKP